MADKNLVHRKRISPTLIRELSVAYDKGGINYWDYSTKPKGIYFRSTVYEQEEGSVFKTYKIGMGESQRDVGYICVVPLTNYRPKALREVRERVAAHAEAIHGLCDIGDTEALEQLKAILAASRDRRRLFVVVVPRQRRETMTDTAEYVTEPAKVAAQNDAFRRNACLAIPYGPNDPVLRGRAVVTQAVDAKGMPFVQASLAAIGRVTDFPADNDPDGLHDFGAVEVAGTTVWFKLDLYDGSDLNYGSEAPDDPVRTFRVLTILLPSDW
ncbi:DUF3768 domain-containing protein [uncultured Jannaschia sp.]|uniref:DUF3768 domain-containing protein n=1 Tax=uncultured Jannaschia sp. TaxID=293347 RepID=UPI002604EBBA|nr:DUF3768 domain-containing protein [uncultured Jannaschia sp.]